MKTPIRIQFLNCCYLIRRKQFILLPFLLILYKPALSQLVVDTTLTPQLLVNSIVEPGTVVSNIKLNCNANAIATFTSGSDIGMGKGILLTTGRAALAIGPNNSDSAGVYLELPGDLQLESITNSTTFDACALEFDVVPSSDTFRIKYVFGSEEYPEYLLKSFNDVFGFFISGPNIIGSKNIGLDILKKPSDFINNANGTGIQYDGFTKPITAVQAVTPCSTYHLKIVIADVLDGIYDSGLFIESGSIKFSPVSKDAERCGAGIVNLSAKATSGALNWYTAQTGGSLVYTGSDYSVNLTTTTIFYVENTHANCSSARTPVTGTIHPMLVKPTITENTGVLGAPAGYTYQWYFNDLPLAGETHQTITPTNTGNYKVVISDGNKCSATSDVYSFVLAIKPIALDPLVLIYPNPATEVLYLQAPLIGNNKLTIRIYSVIGKLVYQETYINNGQVHSINTAAIDGNGIYFIELQCANERVMRKVNIQSAARK